MLAKQQAPLMLRATMLQGLALQCPLWANATPHRPQEKPTLEPELSQTETRMP